ncbi:uncharacterized protein VB005_08377 [Metarhizium brunneum]
MAQISRSPPLSKLVEESYGNPVGYRLVRGLVNWRRYRDIISEEAPRYAQRYFRRNLKRSQFKSGQVLQEWWSSAYNDRSFMVATESAFCRSALKILSGDVEWLHRDPHAADNQYHRQLFNLWIHEFMIYDEDVNEKSLSAVFTVRRQGISAAVCQRLAHSVFEVVSSASLRKDIRLDLPAFNEPPGTSYIVPGIQNLSASVDPCPWLTSDEESAWKSDVSTDLTPPPPHFLWDRRLRRTVTAGEFGNNPRYCVVSHTWGRWRLDQEPPVQLEGVPWRIPTNSRFDVNNLADHLDAPFFEEQYLWIDLLCIPQSTKDAELLAIRASEIGRQAQIFQGARRACAWLLEVDSWRGLKWACAWMALKYSRDSQSPGHRQEPSTSLMRATQEYAHQSTELVKPWDYNSRPAPHELEPSAWFTSLWTLQEVCIRPDMFLLNRHMVPFTLANRWIVSLDSVIALVNGYLDSFGWQHGREVNQMRPDLPAVFSQRHMYEAFSMFGEEIGGKSFDHETYRTYCQGVAHTWRHPTGGGLEDPNRLVDPARDIDRDYTSEQGFVPQGPAELLCLLRLTGLDELLYLTRTEILWNANGRYCMRSRAQAIMSVVGATKWYHKRLGQGNLDTSEKPEGLILQTYPHDFLQEVIVECGANFFVNQARYFDLMVPLVVIQHPDGTLQEVRVIHGEGTLLPIVGNRESLIHQRVYDVEYGISDHPSLATWTLSSDGSFNILKAGILATSSDEGVDDEELVVGLTAPEIHRGISPGSAVSQTEVDLRRWLRDFMPFEYKAAVVLYSSSESMRGIILLESTSHFGEFVPRRFVKLGLWYTRKPIRVPESQTVNWKVL